MNCAIFLSGGTGSRLGNRIPKQYMEVNGKPLLAYSLETLQDSSLIDAVVIVAAEEWRNFIMQSCRAKKEQFFASPGRNRQESIYHALACIREKQMYPDTVFIHDAARPYLTEVMIHSYYEALPGHDGVLPVLPMKDTIYYSENGSSVSTLLDRSRLFSGQAPEIFLFEKYLAANEALLPDRILTINGSSEPAILAGMDICMVSGEERNYKITSQEDLERFLQETKNSVN